MYRFLNIKNNIIHIPSISYVYLNETIIGRPCLEIHYQNQKIEKFKYGFVEWKKAENDLFKIKNII